MEWIYDNKRNSVLSLSIEEAKRIAEILKTKESVLKARYIRYRDKKESGYATEKDIEKLIDAEEDLNLVRAFITESNL